jgi:hypothetical protein
MARPGIRTSLVVPLLYAVIAVAQAAEPVPLESLAAPLLRAQTYCESGKWGTRFQADPSFSETHYRVCAHSDGRFKYVENPERPHELVIWSDGRRVHRYVVYGRSYQHHDLAKQHSYDRPREPVPALHSRLFRAATRGGAGLDLPGSLRNYRINDELSDPRQTVYELPDSDRRGSARIRVAVADGSINRYEHWYGGNLGSYVEITERKVNPPLADSELGHEVPLLARYSPGNNLPVFIAGLFVVAAILGLVFWTWLFARAEDPENIARLRRRLWRIFAWALGVVAALLGLLAVVTWGGSGHPPAIVYVMVMAIWAAIAFGLAACFLVLSYAGEALSAVNRRSNRQD